ncbi:MAG: GMC family oxidoreductase [Deltaproteobacteria bacterium]|nr:GMC family oxidoreductase [Deltaproteobacteria bacterium]
MTPGKLLDSTNIAPGTRLKADACIVGSGAGGAAVAHELTKAGMSVVVLEEGRSFAETDLVTKPSWAFRHLYQGRGIQVGRGNIVLPMAAGRAVGGSTFVNSAICFRTPDHVLDEWVKDHGSPWTKERMAPLFGEIETALDVAKTPPELARKNSLTFKRGADKLGLDGDFISRNAPGCVGCGVCQLGCPTGGKGSVDKNLLPRAISRGAMVLSETHAHTILVDKGVARGVVANVLSRDEEAPMHEVTVEAERVFLCSGAFGTPQLLQRNKLCNGSGQVGQNLHVHPGQATGAIFDEEIRYWDGVTQGYFVHMDGAILETFTGTPELYIAGLPLGQMNLGKLKHLATVGCMIRDSGHGSITWQGEGKLPSITYDTNDADRKKFVLGARMNARIWFAAGAKGVWPLMSTGTSMVTSEAEAIAALPDDLPKERLVLYGSHPQSTCKFGPDKATSVCKPTGETHEVEKLYIADGSIFPNAVGVNPQISIMSLATGIARDVAKHG